MNSKQWCRNRGARGAQYLADQLTLFKPGRADYPHLLLLAHSMFFTFRHHCGVCWFWHWICQIPWFGNNFTTSREIFFWFFPMFFSWFFSGSSRFSFSLLAYSVSTFSFSAFVYRHFISQLVPGRQIKKTAGTQCIRFGFWLPPLNTEIWTIKSKVSVLNFS